MLHEGGIKPTDTKRNVVANQPTSATSTLQTVNIGGGKRDYVANFPQLRPTAQTVQSTSATKTYSTQNSNGKRDYVAPQYPTTKPTFNNQQSTNKVKDLINFYDGKNNGKQSSHSGPSYSSILQGTTNKNTPSLGPNVSTTKFVISPTTARSPTSPTKPLSFSAVVAGSNKPGVTTTYLTTPKPATFVSVVPTARPGSPVLPSTILNNNKNQGSTSNVVSDAEIEVLTEELLRKDVNNAAKYITVNYQEKTTSQSTEDKAPQQYV